VGDGPASPETRALLRTLPSVDELLTSPSLKSVLASHPRARSVAAVRLAVQRARERVLSGDPRGFDEGEVSQALAQLTRANLRPVLNATGVVLHTNLGRAPLAEEAVRRVAQVARGYCNLEYDLEEGERGSRYAPVVELLRDLTGAEDAIVVNNCAAAVLLALSALASGKEAIVSRGELVEIGGGFRIPDVMRQSGATLVEVGTTNRTRVGDYEKAIGERTGALVKVHPSNFALVGFTEEAPIEALAKLAQARGLPLFCDLGSGNVALPAKDGLTHEPTIKQVVAAGANLISFSGDKLLGGPQAGVIVGDAALISRVRSHPLNRAVRVDKMTVAALEATLAMYRDGREAEVPTVRLLRQTTDVLRARALRLHGFFTDRKIPSTVEKVEGQVGGGAMPLAKPVSYACAIAEAPSILAERLRDQDPPVIARLSDERLLFDVRCLDDADLERVAQSVAEARRC
jgi:L-seryl-tRNA(Ser) seleniumtransferase